MAWLWAGDPPGVGGMCARRGGPSKQKTSWCSLLHTTTNAHASKATTTTSAARRAASRAGLSSSRADVSTRRRGTPSGVASAGRRVGGSVGGGWSANASAAAAVMRQVFPTPGSPTTATVTPVVRVGRSMGGERVRGAEEGGTGEEKKGCAFVDASVKQEG